MFRYLWFQNQSGFCLICFFAEANVLYIPLDPPLVLHMPTSQRPAAQSVTSPHASAEVGLGSDSNGQSPAQKPNALPLCQTYKISIIFRGAVDTTNGWYGAGVTKPTDWIHFVLNFIGASDGEGVRIFINGVLVGSDTTITSYSYTQGDGRIVLGRMVTNEDKEYASAVFDDLLYFNKALTNEEIRYLFYAIN